MLVAEKNNVPCIEANANQIVYTEVIHVVQKPLPRHEVRQHRFFNGEGMTDKDHVGSITRLRVPVVPTNLNT